MDSGLFGGRGLPPWLKGKFGAARGAARGVARGRAGVGTAGTAGTVGAGVGVAGTVGAGVAREGASGDVAGVGGVVGGSGCGEAGKVPRSGNVATPLSGGAFSAVDLERTARDREVAYYPLLSGGGPVRVGELGLEDWGGVGDSGGGGGVGVGNVDVLCNRLDLWMKGVAVDIGRSVLGDVYLREDGVIENFAVQIIVTAPFAFFSEGQNLEKEFAILHFRAESGWWVSTKVESVFGLLNCELHIDNYLIYLRQLIYRAYSA